MIKKLIHYTKFESALKIIESCSLKSTKPTNLNDPCECNPRVKKIEEYSSTDLCELFNQHIAQKTVLYNDAMDMWRENANPGESFDSYFRTFDPSRIKLQETIAKYFSIISFAESPYIAPMFAHYGENHSGVALEFDVQEMPFSDLNKGHIHEVMYSNERPLHDHLKEMLRNETDQKKYFISVMTTKDNLWGYENEHRMILPKGADINPQIKEFYREIADSLFLCFPEKGIKRIYCGMHMSKLNFEILTRFSRAKLGKDIEVIPLTLSQNSFLLTDK